MKIKAEQLSGQARSAIIECLREVGVTRYAPGSFNNHWYLGLARKIEHGELILCKYVYDEQKGGSL